MTWDLEAAQKDGYEDFMSKEMHEQPGRWPTRCWTAATPPATWCSTRCV